MLEAAVATLLLLLLCWRLRRSLVASRERLAAISANPPRQGPTSSQKVVATNTLRTIARQLREGRQLGVQVSVWFRGEETISIVAGVYRQACSSSDDDDDDDASWLPITTTTLLHNFSVTKGIVAALLLALVDDGVLSYDQPVSSIWPAMHDERIGRLTVAELISHRGGLYISIGFACRFARMLGMCGWPWLSPPDPAAAWRLGEEHAQRVPPRWDPGTESHYTPVCWSWIAGGIILRALALHNSSSPDCVDGNNVGIDDGGATLRDLIKTRLGVPLGCADDLHLGFDPSSSSREEDLKRLARVEPISLSRCFRGVSLLRVLDTDPRVLSSAMASDVEYVTTRDGLATKRCSGGAAFCICARLRGIARSLLAIGAWCEGLAFAAIASSEAFRNSALPSSNSATTARAVASIYAAIGGNGAVVVDGEERRIVSERAVANLHARLRDSSLALAGTKATSFETSRLGCGFSNWSNARLVGTARRARTSLSHNGSGGHVAYTTTDRGEELAIVVLTSEYKPVGLNGKTSVQSEAIEIAAAVRADIARAFGDVAL